MEKEFVPYEIAVELKELGFDESCFGYYEPNKNLNYIEKHILKGFPYLAKNSEWQDLCGAPTYSQAFRFLQKELSNNIAIATWGDGSGHCQEIGQSEKTFSFDSEDDCLKHLIHLVNYSKK
jgi:hypothetical protein